MKQCGREQCIGSREAMIVADRWVCGDTWLPRWPLTIAIAMLVTVPWLLYAYTASLLLLILASFVTGGAAHGLVDLRARWRCALRGCRSWRVPHLPFCEFHERVDKMSTEE